ncbi:response regulator transcription factor [Sphingomonas sp. CGMCC 1.13654]|uniref:Response regulator transcription factor n=1 Tax=Sphingomonas chungangi TaxID=2683589 RepID=A0A838L7N3_9SPHN|nr:response regulator transcription factor [Sphingomonas chungangi]MBA2934712.1 response regulator transcription factor [Sphingomonas chungangi]
MSIPAKIMVIEDDPAIRRLLRVTLERVGHAVAEAATAREGLSLLGIEKPQVVLLDLGLPDRDGLELVQLIKSQAQATLIVVSARESTGEKVAALDLGADDYLTKPFDTEELLARVRAGLRHRLDSQGAEHRVEAGEVVIDLDRRRVTRAGEEVHLAPKEYGVLALLAQRPDRVLSHAQILRDVWGPAQADRVEYLRIVVRALRQKLEADPARPALIVNELGVGYRLRPEV